MFVQCIQNLNFVELSSVTQLLAPISQHLASGCAQVELHALSYS